MSRTKQTARKSTEPVKPNYGPRKKDEDINCDSSEEEKKNPVVVGDSCEEEEENSVSCEEEEENSVSCEEEEENSVSCEEEENCITVLVFMSDGDVTPDMETDRPLTPDVEMERSVTPAVENELGNVLCEGGDVREYLEGRKVVFIVGGKRGKPISVDSRKALHKGGDVMKYLEGLFIMNR